MSDCWNPIKEIIKMSPARSWLDHNQEVKMCFYLFFTKEKILCISRWINYFSAFLARLSFPVFRLSVISIVIILIFGLFVRHYLVCIWLFTLHVNSRVKHYYPYYNRTFCKQCKRSYVLLAFGFVNRFINIYL